MLNKHDVSLTLLERLDGTDLVNAYLLLERYIGTDGPVYQSIYCSIYMPADQRFADLMSAGYSTDEITDIMSDDGYDFDCIMCLIDNCESCNV